MKHDQNTSTALFWDLWLYDPEVICLNITNIIRLLLFFEGQKLVYCILLSVLDPWMEHILITSQCLWTDFHVLSYDMFVHIVVRCLWFFLNDSEVLNKYSSSTPCWTLSYITVISVIYDNIAQNNLVIRLIDTDRNDLFLQFKPRSSGGMWLHLLHRCTSVQIWSNCTLVENFLCVLFYSTTSQRLICTFYSTPLVWQLWLLLCRWNFHTLPVQLKASTNLVIFNVNFSDKLKG